MEHPEHSGAVRTYLDHLYADNLRYVACRATDRESFLQWQDEARPVLQHMLGLESIGASLGDHTIQVQLGAAQDMGDYTLQPGVITTEPRFGLPFWYLQPKG